MSPTTQYASFLIRLWRENDAGACDGGVDWESEVEHVQTGERWAFHTVEELLAFPRQKVNNRDDVKTVLDNVQ